MINKRNITQRNYGIDLLRLISMYMVVVLHILGNGGVLEKVQGGRSAIAWLLEIGAYCAVDCYALISGFVCYNEKQKAVKHSRYITLWLQVVFYCILISLFFYIRYPEVMSKKYFVYALLPVTFNQYWYFTSYTGIFLVIPLLNKIVQNFTNKEISKKFCICLVLFTGYTTAAGYFGQDLFGLKAGYSFLWLAILYIIGAYVKKIGLYKNFQKKNLLFTGVLLLLLTWGWKLCIGRMTMRILGREFADRLLISYTSPTILGIALVLLFYFAQVNTSAFVKKCIGVTAPAAFGVYLIHTHPLIFSHILKGRFAEVAKLSPWLLLIAVLGIAIAIFTVCILLDKLRACIFKLLKLNQLAVTIETKARKSLQIISHKTSPPQ